MNKLLYKETISHSTISVKKTYKTEKELMADYDNFKNTWEEIAKQDQENYKITETVVNHHKTLMLATKNLYRTVETFSEGYGK